MGNKAKTRITELTKQLKQHNYNYYVLSQPTISDFKYDKLLKELEQLETAFPQYALSDSPTKKVGSDLIADKGKQFSHGFPMYSLGNTYSIDELNEFDQRVKKGLGTDEVKYTCELKFDGASINVIYQNGKILHALTRGDGILGDNITENAKVIYGIPYKLNGSDYPQTFEIRGEVLMEHSTFQRLNNERKETSEQAFANPRNAASGSLKLLDSKEVKRRHLICYFYYFAMEKYPLDSHYLLMQKAKQWGLPISQNMFLANDILEVKQFIADWEDKRKTLPFSIDGVVIKVDNFLQQNELGFTSKFPRWSVAYKYKAERIATKLLFVSFQVGRTGAITPVANLEPVFLSGTTVKRASLHNEDQIRILGLCENDTVYIEKGGEIIPKIVDVEESKRFPNAKQITFIDTCPECGTPLIKKDNEAKHFCPNEMGCKPQIIGKLLHFVSRKAMNIDGLGDEIIEMLYNNNLVKTFPDFYKLKIEDLASLERLGNKSAQNIVTNIKKSSQIPFEKVLYALGIRDVGETTAKILVKQISDISMMIDASSPELFNAIKEYFIPLMPGEINISKVNAYDLKDKIEKADKLSQAIEPFYKLFQYRILQDKFLEKFINNTMNDKNNYYDIPVDGRENYIKEIIKINFPKAIFLYQNFPNIDLSIITNIVSYFENSNNVSVINKLKLAGINLSNNEIVQTKANNQYLLNKKIVISGTFKHFSRDEYKKIIEEYGGQNISSVTSKTNFILAGENAGPIKIEKAKNLNIEIINESEFLDLIKLKNH